MDLKQRSVAIALVFGLMMGGMGGAPGVSFAEEIVRDEHGRVVEKVDDEGHRTHYGYHPNGRVARILHPDGTLERFDEQGNPLPE